MEEQEQAQQEEEKKGFGQWLKRTFIGKPRDPHDQNLLHNISLIAFFAWIGLGADGLSSSAYGPQEAFITLHGHYALGIFVAIASALTVFVISASYSQIIEIFPHGGGGYIVASRLLSPTVGMISGCALLIDYVLTISVSVASGADAVFSFLPEALLQYKLPFAIIILLLLVILNLRGVKESVTVLMPIFLVFVVFHVALIGYSFAHHLFFSTGAIPTAVAGVRTSFSTLGLFGAIFLIMKAYSMGAGTYTGIEAVSNGTSILREPKVQTAKKTMFYMSTSLAFMVIGIIFSYVFYQVVPEPGKTMNAVLFTTMLSNLGGNTAFTIVLITLLSEALLLFVAAQTGFIDGPRVLANMALDRWMPKRFAILSDRLVTINGILIMGTFSLALMFFSHGSVGFLVVLYSINVFLTFFLSQLGMVVHWWNSKMDEPHWIKKLFINGTGLIMTSIILISVVIIKFHEGGWITILITGTLVAIAVTIKRNYVKIDEMEERIDEHIMGLTPPTPDFIPRIEKGGFFDPQEKTAVILVKDYTGVGLQTISQVLHSFKGVFKNFIFLQIGLINAGTLVEVKAVQAKIKYQVNLYIQLMEEFGYHAEGICLTGIDTVEEFVKLAPKITGRFPNAVFFGGQVVFPKDTFLNRWLHNYTLFAIQRRMYNLGIPLFIVPIQLKPKNKVNNEQ